MYIKITYFDHNEKIIDIVKNENILSVPEDLQFENIKTIDICPEEPAAYEGDNGYFVYPNNFIGYFKNKEGLEDLFELDSIPIFGIKKGNILKAFYVIGMHFDAKLVSGAKDGEYYYYIRFYINGEKPYEKIEIRGDELAGDDADYSGLGRWYRRIKLENNDCVPMKDRMTPELNYAKDSVYVRIRMCWKPVPPKVLEQTAETEPEIYVACTFEDVEKLMREFKRQEIDKAEFCLVGWNIGGHDGRYPTLFPVEPKLGGETGLRKLLKTAKELGYVVSCHTNSSDCYSISDRWKDGIAVKKKDGSNSTNSAWSGGTMYQLCAEKAWEFAKNDLPQVADLGFGGLHYLDVMTSVKPPKCYDENHSLTRGETVEYYHKIAELCHEIFGGFSSEGGNDFMAKYLDFALYTAYSDPFKPWDNFMGDESVPLWQIVYHGIIMSNPYQKKTVNAPLNGMESMLKSMEYGGRPVLYFYSKFVENSVNGGWAVGGDDFVINDPVKLENGVSKIKSYADCYSEFSHLQTEFMEKHERIGCDKYKITYSNGEEVVVDYGSITNPIKLMRKEK